VRHRQPQCRVQRHPGSLVKQDVWSLEVLEELCNVNASIARSDDDRLRTAMQPIEILHNFKEIPCQGRHSPPTSHNDKLAGLSKIVGSIVRLPKGTSLNERETQGSPGSGQKAYKKLAFSLTAFFGGFL